MFFSIKLTSLRKDGGPDGGLNGTAQGSGWDDALFFILIEIEYLTGIGVLGYWGY
jgi:hypothetical protein